MRLAEGGGGPGGGAEPGHAAVVKRLTQAMWNGRLRGVQRNVEVWQALLRWAFGEWEGTAQAADLLLPLPDQTSPPPPPATTCTPTFPHLRDPTPAPAACAG